MTDSGQIQTFRRPRLKRTIEPIEAPNGDIHLMRSWAEDVRVPNPSDRERRLLGALDGTRSLPELEREFEAEEVRNTLDQMREWSLLEDAADEDAIPEGDKERLDRQLRYFSDVAAQGGPSPAECQERLRKASVAVLGAGGLGGRTAYELAACGVGEIRLIDGDRVEMSNLNRQIQYREADIGSLKAEIMAERLRAFNSSISVSATCKRLESQAELTAFIEGAAFVVGSADWPPFVIEGWCNAACFEAGIPYITMNQMPPLVRIGPLYVPGRTGCFECQAMRYRRDYPLLDVVIDQRRGFEPQAVTLGPASGVIGGLVGMEVLHFLTGVVEPACLGVGLTLDSRTMTFEREPVIQENDCPVCGSS
jgi:bacteriocin biosynthesis cyclodehydratase domain-containing protein